MKLPVSLAEYLTFPVPPSPTKTSLNVGGCGSAASAILEVFDGLCAIEERCLSFPSQRHVKTFGVGVAEKSIPTDEEGLL